MSTNKFPEHWLVHSRVWLHLLTLGVTPDEIAQLEQLVTRLVSNFFINPSLAYYCDVPAARIWLRQTARQHARKGAKLFGTSPFKARSSAVAKRATATVFVLPKGRKVDENYDPWWPLWKIRTIDLDKKPY